MLDAQPVKSYLTLGARGEARIVRRRSTFTGTAVPVCSEEGVRKELEELAVEFPGASHHPHAWRLGRRSPREIYSDDGEPSGTAGMPLLQLLQGRELTDSLIVVTRLFGGTLLGKGGLARAYGNAGREALERAGVCEHVLHRMGEIDVPYALWGRMEHHLRNTEHRLLDVGYAAEVTVKVAVSEDDWPGFCLWVAEMSGGTAVPREKGKGYLPRSLD